MIKIKRVLSAILSLSHTATFQILNNVKSCLIGKDPVARKKWRQEKKGMTEDRWHHWLNGHEFEQTLGDDDAEKTMAPPLQSWKTHGQRSLVGCSPWGHEESDTTEWLHFHFSLSCIGEGNGNPLQCSCLENPRDGGACWAAVYGVTQSLTQLRRLSSIQDS